MVQAEPRDRNVGGVERLRGRGDDVVVPGEGTGVVVDAGLEVYSARGEPERRAPSPRERGRGGRLLERRVVEDAAEDVVGEVG